MISLSVLHHMTEFIFSVGNACYFTAAAYVVIHDEVIKWKYFLSYWPFLWGINWSLVNSPHKGQWTGALMFSLICTWINGWVNEAGDLRHHPTHYDVIVMHCIHPACLSVCLSGWDYNPWHFSGFHWIFVKFAIQVTPVKIFNSFGF